MTLERYGLRRDEHDDVALSAAHRALAAPQVPTAGPPADGRNRTDRTRGPDPRKRRDGKRAASLTAHQKPEPFEARWRHVICADQKQRNGAGDHAKQKRQSAQSRYSPAVHHRLLVGHGPARTGGRRAAAAADFATRRHAGTSSSASASVVLEWPSPMLLIAIDRTRIWTEGLTSAYCSGSAVRPIRIKAPGDWSDSSARSRSTMRWAIYWVTCWLMASSDAGFGHHLPAMPGFLHELVGALVAPHGHIGQHVDPHPRRIAGCHPAIEQIGGLRAIRRTHPRRFRPAIRGARARSHANRRSRRCVPLHSAVPGAWHRATASVRRAARLPLRQLTLQQLEPQRLGSRSIVGCLARMPAPLAGVALAGLVSSGAIVA
jgi:hypothetical protein